MSIVTSFINHARLAFTGDVAGLTRVSRDDAPANLVEKGGDLALWPTRELPKKLVNLLRDPKFWTVAFTGSALLVNSAIFYPSKTWNAIKTSIRAIGPVVRAAAPYARFSTWALVSSQIVALGGRSLGRFGNTQLMGNWDGAIHFNSQSEQ